MRRLTSSKSALLGASRREYRYFAARKRFSAVSQTTPRILPGSRSGRMTANSLRVLAPLTSDTVTSIVGFTELADDDQLYNAAAVFHRGRVTGLYRKLHPAIRRSVYSAGSATPVFRVGELTFGIVICYDSTFSEPARAMAAQGAIGPLCADEQRPADKACLPRPRAGGKSLRLLPERLRTVSG